MKTQTTFKIFEEKRVSQPNNLIGGGDDSGSIERGKVKLPSNGKE